MWEYLLFPLEPIQKKETFSYFLRIYYLKEKNDKEVKNEIQSQISNLNGCDSHQLCWLQSNSSTSRRYSENRKGCRLWNHLSHTGTKSCARSTVKQHNRIGLHEKRNNESNHQNLVLVDHWLQKNSILYLKRQINLQAQPIPSLSLYSFLSKHRSSH